jgi:hypothetical protein
VSYVSEQQDTAQGCASVARAQGGAKRPLPIILCPTLTRHLTARDGGNAKGLSGTILVPVPGPTGVAAQRPNLLLTKFVLAMDGLMSRSAWTRESDHMGPL